MKPVSDFFSRTIPLVPGCPDPVAEQALVDSAIYFCAHSNAIRYTADTFNTVAGQSQYDIDVPTSQEFGRVMYLVLDEEQLHPTTSTLQPLEDVENAKPTRYFLTQNESELQLNLYATPDDVYAVQLQVALQPTRNAKYVEDDLLTYWSDAIVYGAVSRLKSIPQQPYTDYMSADYYARKANFYCNQARNEGNIGRVIGSLQVKPRPFV